MNLDDLSRLKAIDAHDMRGRIEALPDQMESAWASAQSLPLEGLSAGPRQVIVAGMGGSAIGGALLAAYADRSSRVPVVVWRNYSLPAWAMGPETLVIAASYSGDTEETLSAFEAARERKASLLVVTTGGALADRAKTSGVPLWQFHFATQPRAAVGFMFLYPLAALARLGLLADPRQEVRGAIEAMRAQQRLLRAEIPTTHNPAKRMAGQWMGRLVSVFGSDYLAPVARRWKTQISEIAKAWGQFEELPELNHNTIEGTQHPDDLVSRIMVIFLRSSFDHERNQLRARHTRELLMVRGLNTDEFLATGPGPLAHIFTTLHFGDYASFYLAMAYGTDPTPVETIAELKKRLGGQAWGAG